MQRSLLSILVLLAVCPLWANAGVTVPANRNSSFRDSTATSIPSMQQMLDQITGAVGLQNNFILKEGDVLNIEATLSHKQRLIVYNPAFMEWINKAVGNKWGSIALIAHEMGHHLNGHTLHRTGSEPALELEADEFAGYVLKKLGATLEQAQRVMIFIASNEASATHPGRADRMLAIKNGWDRAS